MDGVTYREMQPEDVAATLALRNHVFLDDPPAPLSEGAWAADGTVAAIAVLGGAVVGAIPMAPRPLVIAPGITVRAPFENSVGVRADLRGQGIGSGMVAAANDFMRDRADGLFVYPRHDRTSANRFYARTGHHDLLATRVYHLKYPAAGTLPPGSVFTGSNAIGLQADHLLPVFTSAYGRFGGFPPRNAGYWRRALASSIFTEMPTDFFLLQAHEGKHLAGYAIVGINTRRDGNPVEILELATLAGDLVIAGRVLATVGAFAAERGIAAQMAAADEDPFVPALLSAGFIAGPRDRVLKGRILDVAAFFLCYWQQRVALDGVGLRIWTEAQDYLLVLPGTGFPTLTLEMPERTLHRWLLGRIDLASRLREGTVTAYGAPLEALHHLSAVIPHTPWAYQRLDYI